MSAPVAVFLLLGLVSLGASAATLEDVGHLQAGADISVTAMSGDGQVLLGTNDGPDRAFRWLAATGWLDIGTLPGNTETRMVAASFDGQVLVASGDAVTGMRWVPSLGWHDIGFSVGFMGGTPTAMSADGTVVAGDHELSLGELGTLSTLMSWTQGLGTTEILSICCDLYRIEDITADGDLMLVQLSSQFGTLLHRMTPDGTLLPVDPDESELFDWPEGNAMSADGSTIVGSLRIGTPFRQAARWVGTDTPLLLGFLDPGDPNRRSEANDVSGNGSVVVGSSDGLAFVWTEVGGMRDLKEALEAAGLDLTGWTLTHAVAVSRDGSVIAGLGMNPTGQATNWRAEFPELVALEVPAGSALARAMLIIVLGVGVGVGAARALGRA